MVNYNEDYTYQWDMTVAGQDCYFNCDSVIVSPQSATTYYITVINEFGCLKKDSITIEVESKIEDNRSRI